MENGGEDDDDDDDNESTKKIARGKTPSLGLDVTALSKSLLYQFKGIQSSLDCEMCTILTNITQSIKKIRQIGIFSNYSGIRD